MPCSRRLDTRDLPCIVRGRTLRAEHEAGASSPPLGATQVERIGVAHLNADPYGPIMQTVDSAAGLWTLNLATRSCPQVSEAKSLLEQACLVCQGRPPGTPSSVFWFIGFVVAFFFLELLLKRIFAKHLGNFFWVEG